MATAKKLKSGSWRCLVYDSTDANGKRHYESFTSDNPSPAGKREAEYLAAEFAMNKKRKAKPMNYTLIDAIDKYINSSDAVLSPTTIQGYEKIKRNAFQEILPMQLKDITEETLRTAVNEESKRVSKRNLKNPKPISPKTVSNEYGLIITVINRYYPELNCSVRLPARESTIKELIPPEILLDLVKGTIVELPVLLAIWLSFSMSEIRGLTKSKSIDGDYLTIREVVVDVGGEAMRKGQAKTLTRVRRHKIPSYIKSLIDGIDGDILVPMSGHAIYCRFTRMLEKNDLPHMTFHDLRHINASIMALLHVPDKYAMERGGWKTDAVMKRVYTHTFSEERKEVDDLIDRYFEDKMQHEMQHKK